MMSLCYLILWNQLDILQKHFKKDHVHMRLWTRFYGIGVDCHECHNESKLINIKLIYFTTGNANPDQPLTSYTELQKAFIHTISGTQ